LKLKVSRGFSFLQFHLSASLPRMHSNYDHKKLNIKVDFSEK
jgi:hypothetical protein